MNIFLRKPVLPALLSGLGIVLILSTACGRGASGDPPQGAPGAPRSGGGGAGDFGGPGGRGSDGPAAVPVEVAAVERRSIASYLQTNGTLEAENEVDIVARTAGPVVELRAEEGMVVRKGQLLARIDETEARAALEIAKVRLQEAERTFVRAESSHEEQLISQEEYEQLLAAKESAAAEVYGRQVVLDYTRITAPFAGIVVERVVKLAENVSVSQKLFRLSDFDPLWCRIQVPEKELSRLRAGQPAELTVEGWPDERFPAKVLRVSPVVEAATGTIRVTLEVDARGQLRPGMLASVFLEIDRHERTLAIPKAALSLESLGDTVYVVNGEVAARRPIELGFEDTDAVEVLSGLEETDRVIVVGQDGLSDGTPIHVLVGPGAAKDHPNDSEADVETRAAQDAAGPRPDAPTGSGPSPERLDAMKQEMRERGMTDAQIEERLKQRRERR
jgi:RND family efflux transporter MFP subunit